MIDPNYISGFIDGEGSFLVSFSPREKLSTGLEIRPSFSASQREDRSEVLSQMKSYFDCGSIRFNRYDQTNRYEVRSLEKLNEVIIPHFRKHPLLSSKVKDFAIFCQVCELMSEGKHKTIKGLKILINLALKMNVNGSRRYSKEFLLNRLKI